jgi:MoaE-MoaD fusion protein
MRVTVELFAQLREVAGRSSWECEVPDTATVRDVWRAAVGSYPDLVAFDGAISAAVNADFATMTSRVLANDDVAFLPPVSGGAR